MRSIRASALTLLVLGALWYLATRPLMEADAAPLDAPAPVSTDLDATIPGVAHYEPRTEDAAARRDLFGYVELPPAPVIVAAPPPVVVPPPVVEVAPPQPIVDPAPHFAYRFIGRFGRERDPIAAFAANGDVRTVRRGDRIDEHFTLQSIGPDAVDVVDETGRVVRVRLGE